MAMILTEKNFKKGVLASKIPVLVDFFASWCPPCKMLMPMVEELAVKLEGKTKVAKLVYQP